MSIYDKILMLCSKNGITVSRLCLNLGLSKNAASGWKRGSRPNDITLSKIADYFHISPDYFNDDNEDVIRQAKFEADMKMELFGTLDVPDEVYSEVKDLAVFLLDRYNSRKEDNI